ncbi:MAG: hypothetical protein R3C15_20410 [Thermoleophilia bacterium]
MRRFPPSGAVAGILGLVLVAAVAAGCSGSDDALDASPSTPAPAEPTPAPAPEPTPAPTEPAPAETTEDEPAVGYPTTMASETGPEPAESAPAETEAPPAAVVEDGFDDPASGWETLDQFGAFAGYEDGAYVLRSIDSLIVVTRGEETYANTIVDVTVENPGEARDAGFGLACRYVGEDDFYLGGVGSDGTYGIVRWQDDEPTVLTGDGQWVPSDVVPTEAERYTIRLACLGNTITLLVDGQIVDSVVDDAFAVGETGVFVDTFDQEDAEVVFDDWRLEDVDATGGETVAPAPAETEPAPAPTLEELLATIPEATEAAGTSIAVRPTCAEGSDLFTAYRPRRRRGVLDGRRRRRGTYARFTPISRASRPGTRSRPRRRSRTRDCARTARPGSRLPRGRPLRRRRAGGCRPCRRRRAGRQRVLPRHARRQPRDGVDGRAAADRRDRDRAALGRAGAPAARGGRAAARAVPRGVSADRSPAAAGARGGSGRGQSGATSTVLAVRSRRPTVARPDGPVSSASPRRACG